MGWNELGNIPGTGGISPQQIADISTNNAKVSADGSINTHNNVHVNYPAVGDVLSWDGTNWTNTSLVTLPTLEYAQLPYLSAYRKCPVGGQAFVTESMNQRIAVSPLFMTRDCLELL
jgi:hypothetical protein